ncbi:MAG: hypothetical protein QG578_1185 [Thermodesulfobacteriota bacterium]|nr:hypothetical protein [Thermodesulfobacteriota bacterium]
MKKMDRCQLIRGRYSKEMLCRGPERRNRYICNVNHEKIAGHRQVSGLPGVGERLIDGYKLVLNADVSPGYKIFEYTAYHLS